MVADTWGPALQVDQSIDSGQLAAQLFLTLGVDDVVKAADVIDGNDGCGCARHWTTTRRYSILKVKKLLYLEINVKIK